MSPPFGSSFPCPLTADQLPPNKRRLTIDGRLSSHSHHVFGITHPVGSHEFPWWWRHNLSSPNYRNHRLLHGCMHSAVVAASFYGVLGKRLKIPHSRALLPVFECGFLLPWLPKWSSPLRLRASMPYQIVPRESVLSFRILNQSPCMAELWFAMPAGISSCIRASCSTGDLGLARWKPLFCKCDGCLRSDKCTGSSDISPFSYPQFSCVRLAWQMSYPAVA